MAIGVEGLLGDAGINIPQFSGSGNTFVNFILITLGIILFAILLALAAYKIYNHFRYNKKIKVYRTVGNKVQQVYTKKKTGYSDLGAFERISKEGDFWCRLRKLKKILPRPTIQMGENEFWFFEREDGEYINFGLKDIDAEMKAANIFYVDEDMRLQRLGIGKNLRDRLQKQTFWEKYGGIVMNLIFIIVITLCIIIIFSKMKDNFTAAESVAQSNLVIAEKMEKIATSIDNVLSRSQGNTAPTSGVVPAEGIFFPFFWKRRRKHDT